jgi:hypothetical protein
MIRFHAWKPAFAPVFPLTDAASGIEKSGAHRFKAVADTPLLDDTWPTAWISVAPSREGIEAVYYSQPEQAALYDPKTSVPGSNMLALYQAPVARFQNAALANSYPLAIYAGLAGSEVRGGFPPGRVRDFEMQILNRFRKEKISEIPKLLPLTPELDLDFTTTPQGLIAKIRGLKWESVLLAQNLEDGSKLEFVNLGDNLREALQSNQILSTRSRLRAGLSISMLVPAATTIFATSSSLNSDAAPSKIWSPIRKRGPTPRLSTKIRAGCRYSFRATSPTPRRVRRTIIASRNL